MSKFAAIPPKSSSASSRTTNENKLKDLVNLLQNESVSKVVKQALKSQKKISRSEDEHLLLSRQISDDGEVDHM